MWPYIALQNKGSLPASGWNGTHTSGVRIFWFRRGSLLQSCSMLPLQWQRRRHRWWCPNTPTIHQQSFINTSSEAIETGKPAISSGIPAPLICKLGCTPSAVTARFVSRPVISSQDLYIQVFRSPLSGIILIYTLDFYCLHLHTKKDEPRRNECQHPLGRVNNCK